MCHLGNEVPTIDTTLLCVLEHREGMRQVDRYAAPLCESCEEIQTQTNFVRYEWYGCAPYTCSLWKGYETERRISIGPHQRASKNCSACQTTRHVLSQLPHFKQYGGQNSILLHPARAELHTEKTTQTTWGCENVGRASTNSWVLWKSPHLQNY